MALSIYETMAQCQVEQSVTWHLTHPEYTKAVRRDLKVEITRKICEVWSCTRPRALTLTPTCILL